MVTGQPLKVLHVEDNDVDAIVIAQQLLVGGGGVLSVDRARSLAEANALLDLTRYDLLVLDLMLSDAAGLDAVRRISAQAPRCPIVVLTGDTDLVRAARAIRLGVQDVLFKGHTDPHDMVRALVLAVERYHATREGQVGVETDTDQGVPAA